MTTSALRLVRIALLSLVVGAAFSAAASAQSSVGIYNDATGSTCTLSNTSPGFVNAFVVVRPGGEGATGVQFAAPKPACFNASYIGESAPASVLVLGNSQEGVSIALLGCASSPTHVLTIQYFGDGTTAPCCPYPVVPDPVVSDVIVVDCAFIEHVALAMVSAINPDAACSCTGNSAPDKPRFPNPANLAGNVGVGTALGWTASDIDNNLAEFDVYLGTTASPPLVATVTDPTYTPPAPLAELTQYYWRVVARDGGGLETSSDTWAFTTRVANSPPSAPFGPSPFNGALAVPLNASLEWDAGDIDGDVLVYDVYLGASSPPSLVASNLADPSFTPPTLVFGTTYYWRVVARDPLGLETSGSEWHFETRLENYPPAAPFNPAPANSATNVPTDVTVSWLSSDPDADSLWYDVYFGTAAPPPLFATVGTLSLHLPQLMEGTHYNWRVVAHDGVAETSGPDWTFGTIGANLPPAIPSGPVPSDGATGVGTQPLLRWECSDPNGDPLYYDVRLGTVSPPPLVATILNVKLFAANNLVVNETYYWQIVARDMRGGETAGPIWHFTTLPNLPPYTPWAPNPPDGGTSTLSPLLTWNGLDPNNQPVTYDVYFGTQASPPLVASHIAQPSFQPGTLVDGTTYRWRVVSSDGLLETSGPVWSFQARTQAPSLASVELWGDLGGTVCSLNDRQGFAVVNAYVILKPDPFSGATGLQFAAPKPPCFSATWVGDIPAQGYLTIGNSQDGVSMALTECINAPVHVLTIQYLGMGLTPDCCAYSIVADPSQSRVVVVDCSFAEREAQTVSATINESSECPCGVLVPVLISRFDATAQDAGVEVRWELAGDEAAEHFTLLRRDGDQSTPHTVADGTVSGTTGSHLDKAVEPATTYHYELLLRTASGDEFRSPVATVTTRAVEFALGQNHPNPFNPTTAIPYTLSNGSAPVRVRLLIMDVSGRVVRTLVDEYQTGGAHEAVWEGRDDRGGPVSSGIYFSVLDADGKRSTKKMVLLK